LRIVIKDVGGDKAGPPIPVVIPVADAEDEIARKCLDNLAACTFPLRVFLVESSGAEFGYGKSMNAGIRAAGNAEFIIGMDSDAFPKPGAIEKLVAFLQRDPRLGYVGVNLHTPNKPTNLGWVESGPVRFMISSLKDKAPMYAIRRLLKGSWWLLGPSTTPRHRPGKMVGAITTMFVLRRQCFDHVGPFDEEFRVSFVDVDYSYRILISEKWFISTCAEAEVHHLGHATRHAKRDMKESEGLKHYQEKWPKERMRAVHRSAREGKFIAITKNRTLR